MLIEHTVHSTIAGSAEAHHRIANHLALLGGVIRHRRGEFTQAEAVDAARVRDVLTDLSVRLDAISTLHKVLSSNFDDRIGVVRLVGEVCAQIRAIFPPGQVMLSMDCNCAAEVGGDHAAYLGRVVSEMLTNAVKYAHPSGVPVQIHVTCRQNKEWVCVEIADDGVGLPENFNPLSDGGLGFQFMRDAADTLGGRIEFDNTPTGLISRLFIPIALDDSNNVLAFKAHA